MAGRQPIRVAQFAEAFKASWMIPRGATHLGRRQRGNDPLDLPWRIGLAVSGGADSMALAHLSRQLQLQRPGVISITAFVVDHRARKESSQEARKVAGWLTEMGIETKVLELDWSPFSASKDPSAQEDVALSMPTAFETHARSLRFQALGKACQERGINTLLMGHHADDAIETTIWRLSAGARGSGLAGIASVTGIPECHGIFGVSESGTSVELPGGGCSLVQVRIDERNRGSIQFWDKHPKGLTPYALQKFYSTTPPLMANGGIMLSRPLLMFPKSALVATCEKDNVPYVSDPTNLDPTVTVRNAIRSLLSSNSLPRAFKRDSMLSLIRSSQVLLHRAHRLSNMLLSHCKIHEMNPRTGTMVIEFPKDTLYKERALAALSEPQMRQIESMTLRRITELVSPCEKNWYPLRSFDALTSRVFPRRNNPDDHDVSSSDSAKTKSPFTVGSVFFNPLTVKSESGPNTDLTEIPRERNIWFLYRQPTKQSSLLRIDVPIIEQAESTAPPRGEKPSPAFTPWTLWDNRYWFRFSIVPKPGNPPKVDKIPLFIRTLDRFDFMHISEDPGMLAEYFAGRGEKPNHVKLAVRTLLKATAPGASRYTVPVLTLGHPAEPHRTRGQISHARALRSSLTGERVEPGESEEMNDPPPPHFVALPTLGQPLSGLGCVNRKSDFEKSEIFYKGSWWVIEWEWMYKMIDTTVLQLMRGDSLWYTQGTKHQLDRRGYARK